MTNRESAAVIGGYSADRAGHWWFLGASSTVCGCPTMTSLSRHADLYGELSLGVLQFVLMGCREQP
jgi:hypothetical protein